MVMFFPLIRRRNDAKGAGHPEMHEDDLVGSCFEKEILRPAIYGDECLPAQIRQAIRNRPAEIVATDNDFRDAGTDEMRGNPQSGGFYFR